MSLIEPKKDMPLYKIMAHFLNVPVQQSTKIA